MPTPNPNDYVTDAELIAAYPVFADDKWSVTVTSSADALYKVIVDLVTYGHGPTVGETIEEIRDGLLTAMAPTIQGLFVATGEGTNVIQIVSNVPDYSLNVTTDPATLIAAVLAGIAPADRQCALDLMQCVVCPATWGCNTWRGHLAATVHYLKLWQRSRNSQGTGQTGQVTQHVQGPYSTTWGVTTPSSTTDAWWSTTPEGQQFLAMRASLGTFARGMVMGMGCQR